MHCAFVDFKAAFDSIDRTLLLEKLRKTNKLPLAILTLIANMHSDVKAKVKGDTLDFIENIGVKQGDPLGPRLFNIFINDMMNTIQTHGTNPISLDDKTPLKGMLYADDLALFSTTAQGLQTQINNLHAYCNINKLVVNQTKT